MKTNFNIQRGEYQIRKAINGKTSFECSYAVLEVYEPNGDCFVEVAVLDYNSSNIWEPTNQHYAPSMLMEVIKKARPNDDHWRVYHEVVMMTFQYKSCELEVK